MRTASSLCVAVLLACASGGCPADNGGSGTGGAPGSGGQSGNGGSGDATPAGLAISGSVDSAVQADGRKVVLLWEVSSGSPDYLYKFGEGTVTGDRFSVTLPGDPPTEAINSYGLGVAVVAVLAPGQSLEDGRVSAPLRAESMAGASRRHSVVWRGEKMEVPSPPPANFWPSLFPPGYTCGACTPKPDGGSFEGFVPTACDQIQITTFDKEAMCNWT